MELLTLCWSYFILFHTLCILNHWVPEASSLLQRCFGKTSQLQLEQIARHLDGHPKNQRFKEMYVSNGGPLVQRKAENYSV